MAEEERQRPLWLSFACRDVCWSLVTRLESHIYWSWLSNAPGWCEEPNVLKPDGSLGDVSVAARTAEGGPLHLMTRWSLVASVALAFACGLAWAPQVLRVALFLYALCPHQLSAHPAAFLRFHTGGGALPELLLAQGEAYVLLEHIQSGINKAPTVPLLTALKSLPVDGISERLFSTGDWTDEQSEDSSGSTLSGTFHSSVNTFGNPPSASMGVTSFNWKSMSGPVLSVKDQLNSSFKARFNMQSGASRCSMH